MKRPLVVLCSLMLEALWASPALASVAFEKYWTPVSSRFSLLEDWQGSVDDPFRLEVDYRFYNSPLDYSKGTETSGVLLRSVHGLGVGGEYQLSSRLILGANLVAYRYRYLDEGNQVGSGDGRLYAKINFIDQAEWTLALMPELFLPLGDRNHLLSNGWGGGAKLLASWTHGDLALAANAGYRISPDAEYNNLDARKELSVGGGIFYRFSESWSSNLDYLVFHQFGQWMSNSALTARYNVNANAQLSLGGTVPSTTLRGETSSYTVTAGFLWSPPFKVKTRTVQIRDCGARHMAYQLIARRLTPEEQGAMQWPYRSTLSDPDPHKRKKLRKLNLGEATGLTANGIPYVKDSQTGFAFDRDLLPPTAAILDVESASFILELSKVSQDKFTTTEVMCLPGLKVCSGDVFTAPFWVHAINPELLPTGKPQNEFFARQYLEKELDEAPGQLKLFHGSLNLDAKKLLAGSNVSLRQAFVSHDPLTVVIADDTYVSARASLELNLQVDSCQLPQGASIPVAAGDKAKE